MSTITITAGGKAGSYRGDEGVFAATLVTHEMLGPFDAKQPKFPGEKYSQHEWGFAIDDAPDGEEMAWIRTGESTGPKSRTYGIISALGGGKALSPGTSLDVDTQLIGRRALIDVRKNDDGYLDIVSVTPLPKAMQGKPAPAPAETDDSPF